MSTGIYAIENATNGDRYVGQSLNIEKRWAQHRQQLNAGRAHSPALQEAWNYFGAESFKFVILEQCAAEELDKREQCHMRQGSSLNRQSPYVVPMAIENELGINPNTADLDEISPNREQSIRAINDERELKDALAKFARVSVQLEDLALSIDDFLLSGDLLEDKLIGYFWEEIHDTSLSMSGRLIELMRRLDDLHG